MMKAMALCPYGAKKMAEMLGQLGQMMCRGTWWTKGVMQWFHKKNGK